MDITNGCFHKESNAVSHGSPINRLIRHNDKIKKKRCDATVGDRCTAHEPGDEHAVILKLPVSGGVDLCPSTPVIPFPSYGKHRTAAKQCRRRRRRLAAAARHNAAGCIAGQTDPTNNRGPSSASAPVALQSAEDMSV